MKGVLAQVRNTASPSLLMPNVATCHSSVSQNRHERKQKKPAPSRESSQIMRKDWQAVSCIFRERGWQVANGKRAGLGWAGVSQYGRGRQGGAACREGKREKNKVTHSPRPDGHGTGWHATGLGQHGGGTDGQQRHQAPSKQAPALLLAPTTPGGCVGGLWTCGALFESSVIKTLRFASSPRP